MFEKPFYLPEGAVEFSGISKFDFMLSVMNYQEVDIKIILNGEKTTIKVRFTMVDSHVKNKEHFFGKSHILSPDHKSYRGELRIYALDCTTGKGILRPRDFATELMK